jgi:hypothetical protein
MTTEAPPFRITITDRDGSNPATVEAEMAAPGLAVHAAKGADGWTLTHVPTGRAAGWWPEASHRARAMACARALGGIGDWAGADTERLPLRDAWLVLLEHGAWVPTRDPARYRCIEGGELITVTCTGDAGDDLATRRESTR